jgi:DNA-binding transcriptional LysR family regulator
MDVRRLKIFCEVYKQRGYSSAARRLSLTQSAVSQQIKALEAEVGTALFHEKDRSMPTAAGDYLFGEASLVLAHIDDMIAGVRSAGGVGAGRVRFGMIDVAAIELMPRVLKGFKKEYPDVELESDVRTSGELVEGVLGNTLDCAVVVVNRMPSDIDSRTIYDDSIVAVVHSSSQLARETISIEDLKGEPLILYPAASHSRMVIDDIFKGAGIVPAVSMEVHYPAAIVSLVGEGMGVGLISELSARRERLGSTRIVPIKELRGVRRIGVVTSRRRRLTPHAKAFVDSIERF